MTSEGELNPNKATGILLVVGVATVNVSTYQKEWLIMHCAVQRGSGWIFT